MDFEKLDSKPPGPWHKSKTARLVALFSASAIALSGCGTAANTTQSDGCLDEDEDGYCDDGSGRHGGSGTFFYHNGKKYYPRSGVTSGSGSSPGSTITTKPGSSSSSGISSGTSSSGAKGGIGSSGGSSSS